MMREPDLFDPVSTIRVLDWKPVRKATLRGFVSLQLPSGMQLFGLSLHERPDGSHWLGLPSKEWTDSSGQRKYERLVNFADHETAARFQRDALAAIEAHLRDAGEVL